MMDNEQPSGGIEWAFRISVSLLLWAIVFTVVWPAWWPAIPICLAVAVVSAVMLDDEEMW